MQFVVKLRSPIGGVFWLGAPTAEGSRTLTLRERAGVFETREDARSAIEEMPAEFAESGIAFSVESAD